MVSIKTTSLRVGGALLSQPTKSLPRHQTLIRKRHEVDMDSDEEIIPPSPSKRARVEFKDEVEIRIVHDWEKAPELIREEVRQALSLHSRGENAAYDQLRGIYDLENIEGDIPSTATLKNYTLALISNASTLDRSYSGLVHAILKSDWLRQDESYISVYLRFLGNLVSAHGIYLADVLRMLVENLTSSPANVGTNSQIQNVTRSKIYRRSHTALKYILNLIPTGSSVLGSLLSGLFPNPSDSKQSHVTFVRNILRLTEYAPELQSEIFSLITDRLVKIDVQVQVDLEDLADEVGEGVVKGIPQLQHAAFDGVDEDEGNDSQSDLSEDGDLDEEAQRAKDITNNIQKLDAILDILFTHYTTLFEEGSLNTRETLLDVLLSQFTTIIIPTYRSRHTQFLLFHFVQTSSDFIDTFVGTCVHMAFDKGRQGLVRQSAAAYLASFISRGIHVPSQIVRDVFDYIGNQLNILRAEFEPSCRGPDLRRYSDYYSLMQALLYIFCFRWQDLEATSEEQADDDGIPLIDDRTHLWIPGIKETFAQNIFSKLNPLKVCSPDIVNEFAKIAHHLGIIYVFHLLETNKRLRLSYFGPSRERNHAYSLPERETALSIRKEESYQQLDEYFPFDPYHLPKSKRWIEGEYREWKTIPGLQDDVIEESSTEEDEEGDDSEVGEGTGTDDNDSSP